MADRAAALMLPLRSTNAGGTMPERGANGWHRVQMGPASSQIQQGG